MPTAGPPAGIRETFFIAILSVSVCLALYLGMGIAMPTVYVCGHTHNYSAVEIDGVWQLDAGHACGKGDTGTRSTFIMINVDANGVTFKSYRDDADSGAYVLAHTGTLRECVAGYDLDCDMDIADIMLVASRWHTAVGDPDFNPNYDLDNDGAIDIVDIMLVATHWGETCDEQ